MAVERLDRRTHILAYNPPFRTSYGLMLEKTKNRNLSIPVVCAPAGIRTLDTLIKSQLL